MEIEQSLTALFITSLTICQFNAEFKLNLNMEGGYFHFISQVFLNYNFT